MEEETDYYTWAYEWEGETVVKSFQKFARESDCWRAGARSYPVIPIDFPRIHITLYHYSAEDVLISQEKVKVGPYPRG